LFCPHCGTENADTSWNCQACGVSLANPYEASAAAPGVALPNGPVFNWLAPAIIATVLSALCGCFIALPCGIVAIVYAAQVNGYLRSNEVAQGVRSARLARNWTLAALAIWGSIIFLYVGLMIIGVIMDTSF
jgi:hypothetical protein